MFIVYIVEYLNEYNIKANIKSSKPNMNLYKHALTTQNLMLLLAVKTFFKI